MKKRFLVEDIAMVLQWVAIFVYIPFALVSISQGKKVPFGLRLGLVAGVIFLSAFMTLLYLVARRRSPDKAGWVVNATAVIDVVGVTISLIVWPQFLPGLYFVYPLIIIMVAARYSWRTTLWATTAVAALYGLTLITLATEGYSTLVLRDTILRILILYFVAGLVAFLSFRGKRSGRETEALSQVSQSLANCLRAQEVFEALLSGIKMVSASGGSSMYLISADRRWALPRAITTEDPQKRRHFFGRPIDLKRRSAASVVAEEQEPLLIEDARDHPLVDQRWVEDFKISALLCIPMVQRGETKGLIFVEPSDPRRLFYLEEANLFLSMISQAVTVLENVELYESEKRRRLELDLVHRAAREMTASLVPKDVLLPACKFALEVVGGKSAVAFLAESEERELIPVVRVDSQGEEIAFSSANTIRSHDIEDMLMLSQRPSVLCLEKPENISALPPLLHQAGSLLLAPIYSQGEVSGLLCIEDEDRRAFGPGERALVAAIAGEATRSP